MAEAGVWRLAEAGAVFFFAEAVNLVLVLAVVIVLVVLAVVE